MVYAMEPKLAIPVPKIVECALIAETVYVVMVRLACRVPMIAVAAQPKCVVTALVLPPNPVKPVLPIAVNVPMNIVATEPVTMEKTVRHVM